MKSLLKYMKGYRKECILSPLFKLFEAILELLVPLIVADIIDNGIALSDKGYIIKRALILALFAFIGLIFAVAAQFFAAKAAVGFTSKVKSVLFSHITTLSYSEIDSFGTSTLLTRLTGDMNQIQTGVNLALRLLLRSPIVVFGAVIMAFTVDAKTALVFIPVLLILSIIVFSIMFASIPGNKKVQSQLDKVTLKTREALTGARVIRAFCKEEVEEKEYKTETNLLTKLQIRMGKISALMNPLTYVLINAGIIVIIYVGGIRVNTGSLSTGQIVALYNYMSQILVELIKFANTIISINRVFACGDRVAAVLNTNSSIEDNGNKNFCGSDIEFKNVSLTYKGNAKESLSDISFKAKKGEIIGIIGPTGSGKTSIVNLIPRFYEATEGEILIGGVNIKDIPIKELRSKIAVTPQKALLFGGTLKSNLNMSGETDDERLMEAVISAQAYDIIKDRKEGLNIRISQGGKNLSGGQRQRFSIARSLAKNADIIILDDSASALDFATEARLRKAISSLKGSPTVFLISQRTSSVSFADKIIVLDNGSCVGIGTHDQLLSSCEVYKEIYNSQYKKEDDE